MNAIAELEMPVGGSLDVEAVRLRELFGIAVSRGNHHIDRLAGGDLLTTYRDFLCRAHTSKLYRAVVPHHLFGRAHDELRVRAQLRELVWVLEQREHPVGDGVRRRLMSIHQEKDRVREELLQIQPAPLAFGLDERAHDCAVWSASEPADQLFEVREQRDHAGSRWLSHVKRTGRICN